MFLFKASLRLATPLLFLLCFVREEKDRKTWMFVRGVIHVSVLYFCKFMSMSIFGPKYCSRPKNAIHCGMWDRPSQEDKRSGMPSGHSWTAGCFLAVFVLSSKTGVTNRYGQALGLLLALLVALSRLSTRQVSSYISATPNGAHTLPQVIVGFCGGIVLERLLAPNDYDFF